MPRLQYFGGTAKKLRILFEHPEYGCRHLCAVGSISESEWLHDKFKPISLNAGDKIFLEVEQVCSIVRQHNVKIIIGHFFHMSLVAFLAARKLNIPFIYQEHGIVLGDSIIKYPLRFIMMHHAPLITVNSYATAKNLTRFYPHITSKIRVIYNGICPALINNEEKPLHEVLKIPKSSFIIGTIGGYLKIRRHMLLIKSVANLLKNYKNIHLVCLGEGGSEEKKVKNFASELAPANIHFLARTQFVGNFLRDINLYINPAIAEGFGIATCEAMRMGTATISAAAGALPEFCAHLHNSIIFKPDNIEELCKWIAEIIDNPSLASSLGEQAAKDIAARFSPEIYVMNNNAVCYEAVSLSR